MLRKSWILAMAGWLLLLPTGVTLAGTFGQVVSIGGAAADVALDEARGRLYIANFTANRIEVMSLTTKTISTSINVASQPSSISLSPDGHWLAVAHYGNRPAPGSPTNGITLIDLRNNNSKVTFALANPPLGLAFGIDNKALVVTSKDFLLFDPALGTTQILNTIAEQATQSLPAPAQSFPPDITKASVGASADGRFVWGFADSMLFRYSASDHVITSNTYSASPILGPRAVSVSNDGANAALGWWMVDVERLNLRLYAEFGTPLGDLNLGGHAIDSARGLVYSEVPAAREDAPVLTIRDMDNLTTR
ncbi:MAG: hypothetical protein ABI995_01175, partial [Acidobacteriota bacterium]